MEHGAWGRGIGVRDKELVAGTKYHNLFHHPMQRIAALIIAISMVIIISCDESDKPEPSTTIAGNSVRVVFIDENGIKWFGTENGVSCFDNENWTTYTTEDRLANNSVNDIAFQMSYYGPEIWLATDSGASVFAIELDAVTSATSYTSTNSGLAGDTVRAIAIDTSQTRWFGTNGGISVFAGNIWDATDNGGVLTNNTVYDIDTDPFGHAFVTLSGKGVAVMEYIDAISTVTYYEIPWSPLPSSNVLSVYVDENGFQWYGTDNGVAYHFSIEAKQNWQLYTKDDGLIDNRVISIQGSVNGDIWFGTPVGASKFDGQNWTNYTIIDGLAGNTVYDITLDKDGSVWFGTDNGASHFNGVNWTSYRK
jgi:ligand-binding sensor domain-containing protein